ncbi:endosome-associated-trafficking regulator 1 isoform X5 [Xiphophorus hellerii]|uniref:endosome-associated-trafficking regulator 1 isoform X5 n=1 Tax=Xiphophorus hellerii TaxID=8084 RepID=UPI0013B3DE3A|nr:endosome-associated-trafficking regulator 1 isoform X5 [Xiphophorus hellerii]
MSGQRGGKSLIITDDEEEEVQDGLNPFSFKEFLRWKNQDQNQDQNQNQDQDQDQNQDQDQDQDQNQDQDQDQDQNQDQDQDQTHRKEEALGRSFLCASEEEEDADEDDGGEETSRLTGNEGRHAANIAGSGNRTRDGRVEDSRPPNVGRANRYATTTRPKGHPTLTHCGTCGSLVSCVLFQRRLRYSSNPEGGDEMSLGQSDASRGRSLIQQMREENSALRRSVRELQRRADLHQSRARRLSEELQQRKRQEEQEAQDLESMVQSVEQNLQLMKRRAAKAESSVSRLKAELQQLQASNDPSLDPGVLNQGETRTCRMAALRGHFGSL